jgi:Mn2+/Fe2+ NRAMP family transporter
VLATALGLGVGFTGLDPINALCWSAVLNGLLAPPLMAAMLAIAGSRRIMGPVTLPRSMAIAGWLAVQVMAAASIAFLVL